MNLPNELVELIAQRLDVCSLEDFGNSHRRIREVSDNMPKFIKETKLCERTIEYLSVHGASVKSVDLSNCDPDEDRVCRIVRSCPAIKTLKLVNCGLSYCELMKLIGQLNELDTLSFTLWCPGDVDEIPYHLESLKRIRKLYVETTPSESTLVLLYLLLKTCTGLEACHINFIGEGAPFDYYAPSSIVKAQRWETLQTFVCTDFQSKNKKASEILLRCVFACHPSADVEEWMSRAEGTYIYERGIFNNMPEADTHGSLDVLKRFHQIELPSKASADI